VSFKGGPEGYWLVEARSASGVFSGQTAIEDVMRAVLNET
jgi:hypothetical protein